MLNEFIVINGTYIKYNNLHDISSFKPLYERSLTDSKKVSLKLNIKCSTTLNCMYQLLVGRADQIHIKTSNSDIVYKLINKIKTIQMSQGEDDTVIFNKIII